MRQDVCNGQRLYWYRASHYPSEPTFIPTPDRYREPGAAFKEDDGVLVFTLFSGVLEGSTLVTVNATTMETIAEIELPHSIGFTTHGEWYEGLLV